MCILFIYINPNPAKGKYQLILATNRDEYFIRPAQSAHRWPEDEYVIAGKDLEPGREGGTWFGISLRQTAEYKFRTAALLNVTGEHRHSGAAGRGSIVTDYLKGDLKAEDYILNVLKPGAKAFNAFSFVAVELGDSSPRIFHYTNVTDKLSAYHENGESFVGFGNSPPHEPLLKVLEGQKKFQSLVTDGQELLNNTESSEKLMATLRSFLRWNERHLPDPVLARRAPDTYEHLSSVFVNVAMASYGTRTHSIILVDDEGNVEFMEDNLVEPPPAPPAEAEWKSNTYKARL